jgi:hypothetical protein
MPEEKITKKLDDIRTLLREGRTTEADQQIAALDVQIKQQEEAEKLKYPPPGPRTFPQLQMDFYAEVTDLLGNNPRLLALLTEMQGEHPEEV